mgnify:CR=1 FL=1
MEKKSIDKTLEELDALRGALLKQKEEASDSDVIDIEAEKVEEVPAEQQINAICIIEAAITNNGPMVNLQGDLIAAHGLLTYVSEYIKMLMQKHIVQSTNNSGEAPK